MKINGTDDTTTSRKSFNDQTDTTTAPDPSKSKASADIFGISGWYNQRPFQKEQTDYIKRLDEFLAGYDKGKSIKSETISYAKISATVYYVETLDNTKIVALTLLFAEGVSVTRDGYSNDYDRYNRDRVDLPLETTSEDIRQIFEDKISHKYSGRMSVSYVSTVVVHRNDLLQNQSPYDPAEQMGDHIVNCLAPIMDEDVKSINVLTLQNAEIRVVDDNVDTIKNIILQKNPLKIQPRIDIGFTIDLKSKTQQQQRLENFITVGAMVDIVEVSNPKGGTKWAPFIRITCIESSIPMTTGILMSAFIFAYTRFVEQNYWRIPFLPNRDTRNGNRHLGILFDTGRDNRDEDLINYSDEWTFNEFVSRFMGKPIMGIDVTLGMPHMSPLGIFSADNTVDYNSSFLKAMHTFFDSEHNPDIEDLIEDYKGSEFFANAGIEFGGSYKDSVRGPDTDLREVTFFDWISNVKPSAEQARTVKEYLLDYFASNSLIGRANTVVSTVGSMDNDANTVRFSYLTARYFVSRNLIRLLGKLINSFKLSIVDDNDRNLSRGSGYIIPRWDEDVEVDSIFGRGTSRGGRDNGGSYRSMFQR